MVQHPGQRPFDPTRHVPLEPRPLDIKPADIKPSGGPKSAESKASDSKGGPSIARPFPCTFAQYNCAAAFTSKNEWKRHISTKHIQLGFWRCDMCPPSPGIDQPVFNDFNRKDLFTQHLRRMHGGLAPPTPGKDPATPGSEQPPSTPQPSLTEDQIQDIQKRCYKQLRNPPQISNCVFCSRVFQGPNSWEERLEHVGGHLERDRKNGANTVDITTWREDPALRDYLLAEGIVEIDPVRGGWRIGDGKPRRDINMSMLPQMPVSPVGFPGGIGPAGPPPGASQASAINLDTESEGSNGKQKRGRPAKRFSLADPLQDDDAGYEDHDMPDAPPPPPHHPASQPGQHPIAISPQPSQSSTPFQTQMPMQTPLPHYFSPLQPRENPPPPGLIRRESGGYMPPQPAPPLPQGMPLSPEGPPGQQRPHPILLMIPGEPPVAVDHLPPGFHAASMWSPQSRAYVPMTLENQMAVHHMQARSAQIGPAQPAPPSQQVGQQGMQQSPPSQPQSQSTQSGPVSQGSPTTGSRAGSAGASVGADDARKSKGKTYREVMFD